MCALNVSNYANASHPTPAAQRLPPVVVVVVVVVVVAIVLVLVLAVAVVVAAAAAVVQCLWRGRLPFPRRRKWPAQQLSAGVNRTVPSPHLLTQVAQARNRMRTHRVA